MPLLVELNYSDTGLTHSRTLSNEYFNKTKMWWLSLVIAYGLLSYSWVKLNYLVHYVINCVLEIGDDYVYQDSKHQRPCYW